MVGVVRETFFLCLGDMASPDCEGRWVSRGLGAPWGHPEGLGAPPQAPLPPPGGSTYLQQGVGQPILIDLWQGQKEPEVRGGHGVLGSILHLRRESGPRWVCLSPTGAGRGHG